MPYILAFVICCSMTPISFSQDWKVGAAKIDITPQERLTMAGYAGRKEPAEGTEQPLYAKAIVLEDQEGSRVVIVTLDLIGVIPELRSEIEKACMEKFQLPSQQLVMNASHTHCGPAYGTEPAKAYFDSMSKKIVEVIGEAIQKLQPASLHFSEGRCGFAMNRRTPSEQGYRNHPNPRGVVDHQVPVLSARDASGKLIAILFGYACHNTTLGFLKWCGDYAGYAQAEIEMDFPGAVALFMMGCGGDQNPYPRSELKYAAMHGRTLATSVAAAIETGQKEPRHQQALKGSLQCILDKVTLDFVTKDREPFDYPIQIIKFGSDLSLVALASEVTVDYSLRLKRELPLMTAGNFWIAGYSNTYAGYIPSRRVLVEGGYEAQSRPWQTSLEERITTKTHELLAKLQGETLFEAKPLTAEGGFTKGIEGPAWDHRQGFLYAVNYAQQQTIGRVALDGSARVFLTLPEQSVGNGIQFDHRGNMFIADYVGHAIWKVSAGSSTPHLFAHQPMMNQPNDLTVAKDGTLYASDPNWSQKTGQIWRIDVDGTTHRVAEDMGTTNGIELSPDDRTLYVNESVQRKIWAFKVNEDGSLTDKRLVVEFPDYGFDGMRCDIDGNLYVTRHGKGTIVKLSPHGDVIREIDVLGSKPSNLCFGGPHGRTIFVTEVDHQRIVTFRVDRPGRM